MPRQRRLVARLGLCAATVVAGAALYAAATLLLARGGGEDFSCHHDGDGSSPDELPDTDEPTFAPPLGRSIFFHETSCRRRAGGLTARQACAVESAALANPERDVYVLFSAAVARNVTATATTLGALLATYGNVRAARLRLRRYAAGSPLEAWLAGGALAASQHRTSHTSDVLRYLTLWKYGGVYLDLDVVVAKPLAGLAANWAGRESATAIAAGAMSFSWDEDGRRLAGAAIRELRSSFRGYEWSYNGPGVITRVLQRHCTARDVTLMNAERCGGIEVYPEEYLYPVPWREWRRYFEPRWLAHVRNMTSTYVFHVWNKLSAGTGTPGPPGRVPYTYLASRYCPTVYRLNADRF